jgi:hypothetical protein
MKNTANKIEFGETSEEMQVNEYRENILELFWDKWLIFKPKRSKDWQMELKKHLPPYFDTNVNKINDFSMRENVLFPPCPQEFLEHLLNGIILKNELGLYRSKSFFLRELQQLLIEYLKLFYYRIDAIIDIFQTNTKLSISKEKYPKIVVKCSNCNFFVFINVYCVNCENEFYCDETCRKIHSEVHKKYCEGIFSKLPKIIEPLRVEIHVNSTSFGEEVHIYNEHNMKFARMMKGKILLAFLYKSFRKDRWFRNNKYVIEEKIMDHYILVKRGVKVELDILNYETKDFVHKMNSKQTDGYVEDEYRDLLKLSILQELKLNFYKLGALLVDILKEQHPTSFKYILIFNFP